MQVPAGMHHHQLLLMLELMQVQHHLLVLLVLPQQEMPVQLSLHCRRCQVHLCL